MVKDKSITQEHILSYMSNAIYETLLITDINNPHVLKYIQFKKFSSPNSDSAAGKRSKTGDDENHEMIEKVLKDAEHRHHLIEDNK